MWSLQLFTFGSLHSEPSSVISSNMSDWKVGTNLKQMSQKEQHEVSVIRILLQNAM